jgi:hypothetical protein
MSQTPQVWREIRKALLHSAIAAVSLFAAIRGAIGWEEHGFGVPRRYVTAGDDGSFILLLLGAVFFLYGIVVATQAVLAAREAAHDDDTPETI